MSQITLKGPPNPNMAFNTGDSSELGMQPKALVDALNAMFGDVYNGNASVRRPLNLWALAGDSRAQEAHLDAPKRNISASNHFGWGNALSGGRIQIATNQGVSGFTTTQMLATIAACISSGAGVLYIECGVNDPGAGIAAVTSFNNIRTASQAAILAGMQVVICLDPGSTTMNTAALVAPNIELNERLREFATITGGVRLLDLPTALWNAASGSSSTAINMITNYTRDGTHEATIGAYVAGKAFSTLIQSFVPALPRETRGNFDVPSASSVVNLLANPLFNTATGGTVGAGATGPVPGSWTALRSAGSGTQTIVVTTGAPADGSPGTECILTPTFVAAGDELRLQQDVTIGNWSPLDIVQAACELSVDAGANIAAAYLYLAVNIDAVTYTTSCLQNLSNVAGPTEAYKVSLVTERLAVPAGVSKGFMTCHIKLIGSAAGAGPSVRVRRLGARKLFA